jgi:hypothetical protein
LVALVVAHVASQQVRPYRACVLVLVGREYFHKEEVEEEEKPHCLHFLQMNGG